MSRLLPTDFVDSKSVQDDVVKFFASFDDQIKGFEVTKLPTADEDKEEGGMIWLEVLKIGSQCRGRFVLAFVACMSKYVVSKYVDKNIEELKVLD